MGEKGRERGEREREREIGKMKKEKRPRRKKSTIITLAYLGQEVGARRLDDADGAKYDADTLNGNDLL